MIFEYHNNKSLTMFRNYLAVGIRNLWRAKQYTFINIIGLGISIAAIVWAYQNYRFCFSFDNFHHDQETIFRGMTTKEGNDAWMGVFPLPVGPIAKSEFSSIAEVVRFEGRGMDVKGGTSEPFADQVHFTDPAFLDLFNFQLVRGSNDLSDRGAVLITEKTATKYFGKEDPIGKTMTFYAGAPFQRMLTVKGVLADPPMNSAFQFSMLTNFDNYLLGNGQPLLADNWFWLTDAVFFKLRNPDDAGRLAESFKKYLPQQNAGREDWKVTGFRMISLADHAKMTGISANSLMERPEDSAVYGPLVLAILILLSACLNFANTTVARSNSRLKEMGVRKVMGGTQGQLRTQMLLECGAIVVMAFALSVVINRWWLPTFNQMFLFTDTKADYFHDGPLVLFTLAALLGTTLLAGAYPAFYISRFNPSNILKGSVKFGGSNLFSRILLGLQVAISLITVIAGVGFSKNSEFQRTYDYGYDREHVMTVPAPDSSSLVAIRTAVRQLPGVEAMAGSRSLVGYAYRWQTAEAQSQKREVNVYEIGSSYLDVMNMRMAAGRAFDPELQTDYENALLVNEKMAAQFGWTRDEVLGQTIRIDTVNYQVVGTLKDFHSNMLFNPVDPVAMRLIRPEKEVNLVIRAKPGELTNVFDQTKAAWAKLFPLKPFRGFYQNEIAGEAMRVTTSIARIFLWFAIVTVLLTATGLFALVSLTVLKKMREIAIRKVVGAKPGHILALINKGYLWIFLVGAVLGGYGGYTLTKLLMDMIFKVNSGVDAGTLAFSAAVVLVIALATVGMKVWGALRMNPAEVLKGE